MIRQSLYWLSILTFPLQVMPASAQQLSVGFTYHGPGDMEPGTEQGVRDRRVFLPTIAFPLRVGPEAGTDGKPVHAYANSQIFDIPGNPTGFAYPWHDDYCESQRSWPMPACPRGKGHQGQDIRPNEKDNHVWDAVAMEDGVVESVSPFTAVTIRFDTNNGISCRYLHMSPILVSKGQHVKKGVTVIGKVSNIMGGRPDTSIHLHFDCETTHPDLGIKVHVPIYSSLVAAYRRAWGLPDMIKLGVLMNDPEREVPQGALSCPPRAEPIEATKNLTIVSRWNHNCSEMGLVVDGDDMKFVYLRPKLELAEAARRKPVLLKRVKQNGTFQWIASRFNETCHDPEFVVSGDFKPDDASAQFVGKRDVLNGQCAPSGSTTETLTFIRLPSQPGTQDVAIPISPPPEPMPPTDGGLSCPFGREPVQVVDGKERPPKSERSCNFLAVTVPGGISFSQMPRYIREWPGIRTDVLIDKFSDQIITLRTAEGGVGLWWYWITRRARHNAGLEDMGFGADGTPTLAALSRAMAGKERSELYVRQNYLQPYMQFASLYFARTIGETDAIDLSNADNRWNLARTMFRLESGNTPVVNRQQFDCGTQFARDLDNDYKAAGVETGSNAPVHFSAFKGLEYYTNTCAEAAAAPADGSVSQSGSSTPSPGGSDTASLEQKLSSLQAQIGALKVERDSLEQQFVQFKTQTAEAGKNLSELGAKLQKLGTTQSADP